MRVYKRIFSGIVVLFLALPAFAQQGGQVVQAGTTHVLWREPGDISSRNLIDGAGGKAHAPGTKFKFIEEAKGGYNPKFDVEDEQGVRWRIKLGPEAKTETAATRLLWAVGYFADENYYVPELRVEGMPKLSRGQEFVSADGIVHGAGLERRPAGRKKIGTWAWLDNPFVGTKELSGLKIMMALMNNWDIKTLNNAIYDERGVEHHYLASDVGATFGRTGNLFRRTKDNLQQYSRSKFIRETTPDHVDFYLSSHLHFVNAVLFPHLIELRKREKVVKHIPRADARWLGQLLSRLSAEQIGDCFRAAGHSPEEVEGYTKVVQERIRALNQL